MTNAGEYLSSRKVLIWSINNNDNINRLKRPAYPSSAFIKKIKLAFLKVQFLSTIFSFSYFFHLKSKNKPSLRKTTGSIFN